MAINASISQASSVFANLVDEITPAGADDPVARLLRATQALFDRIVTHEFFTQLQRGALPLGALRDFLVGKYQLFSGTFERGLIRARRARDPEIRVAWTRWIMSENGHNEMLLTAARLLGGNLEQLRKQRPSYEAEALNCHCWKTAVCGSSAENLGVAFFASERIYERTWGRIAEALRESYEAPPEAIDVFLEHAEADADHFATGLRLMRRAFEIDPAESYEVVEATTAMALLCHVRFLDSVTLGIGWRPA